VLKVAKKRAFFSDSSEKALYGTKKEEVEKEEEPAE
jgi:hypothetical protein